MWKIRAKHALVVGLRTAAAPIAHTHQITVVRTGPAGTKPVQSLIDSTINHTDTQCKLQNESILILKGNSKAI